MTTRQLYDFIVDEDLKEEDEDERLAELAAAVQSTDQVEEAVFMSTFIPRSLMEVSNCEADLKKLQKGEQESGYASAVSHMINRTDRTADVVDTIVGEDDKVEESNQDVNREGNTTQIEDEGNEDESEDAEDNEDDEDENEENDDDEEDLKALGWRWDGDSKGRLPPAGSDARTNAKALKKVILTSSNLVFSFSLSFIFSFFQKKIAFC